MYIVVGRLLEGTSVVGYVVNSDEVELTLNVKTKDMEVMAKMGTVKNVKCTSEGLTGVNGFKLRELPSTQIVLDPKPKVGRLTVTCAYLYTNEGRVRTKIDPNDGHRYTENYGLLFGWGIKNTNTNETVVLGKINLKPNEEIILTLEEFYEIANTLDAETFINAKITYPKGDNKSLLRYNSDVSGDSYKEVQIGVKREDGIWDLIDNDKYKKAFGTKVEAIRQKEINKRLMIGSLKATETLVYGARDRMARLTVTCAYLYTNEGRVRTKIDTNDGHKYTESYGLIFGWGIKNTNTNASSKLGTRDLAPNEEIILTVEEYFEIVNTLDAETFINAKITYQNGDNKILLRYNSNISGDSYKEVQICVQGPDGLWDLIDNDAYKRAFGAKVAALRQKEVNKRLMINSLIVTETLVYGARELVVGARILNTCSVNVPIPSSKSVIEPGHIADVTMTELKALSRLCGANENIFNNIILDRTMHGVTLKPLDIENPGGIYKTQIGERTADGQWRIKDDQYKDRFQGEVDIRKSSNYSQIAEETGVGEANRQSHRENLQQISEERGIRAVMGIFDLFKRK